MLGTTDVRIIWHFQTVGHVTGEAHVENSRADALVLDDIHYAANKRPRLPSKGTAGFEHHLKVRPALMEMLHGGNKQIYVVVLAGNKMPSTEVYPLYLGEPWRKLLFDMRQGTAEHICSTLAVAVAMKSADVGRQPLGQLIDSNSKACAWSTGVVKQCAHLRILGIDA